MQCNNDDAIYALMTHPATFDDGTERVEVRETHISRVFLTRCFAFKQKKPVVFDFLDFGTLEKREWACREEVRLNRRLAPDVYLDCVPVAADSEGRLRLGIRGKKVVEWMVKMRRLDDALAMPQMRSAGRLTQRHLAQLVDTLVAFYRGQPPCEIDGPGYQDALRRHVSGNFQVLNEVLEPEFASEHLIVRLHQAQLWTLVAHRRELEARATTGHVVEGHGDLRPEHVYFTPAPTILDCIEFNRELRILDASDEICFLAMECAVGGDASTSREILHLFCQAASESPPAWLLDFYLTYRACVRAKVTWLRSRQVPDASPRRIDLLRKMQSYLSFARQRAVSLEFPFLIVMRGLSGTGKSTLARQVAEATGAVLLQTDAIRKQLRWTPPSTTEAVSMYTPEARRRVYLAMLDTADALLADRVSVLMDGTFLDIAHCRLALETARVRGVPILFVETQCPAEVAERRILRRQQSDLALSDADPSVHRAQALEYVVLPRDLPRIIVDTSQTLDLSRCLDSIAAALGVHVEPRPAGAPPGQGGAAGD